MNVPRTPAEVLSRIDSDRPARPSLQCEYCPPSDSLEEVVAQIWSEILGLRDLGIKDNFFELGGDSLHMVQIASRILEQCEVEISFVEFFDNPTISDLAQLIHAASSESADFLSTDQPLNEPVINSNLAWCEVGEPLSFGEKGATAWKCRDELPDISTIVIPTRERPEALRRCLLGLMANLTKFGRSPRIVVADGSNESGMRENESVVSQMAQNDSNSKILIFNSPRIKTFSAAFVDAGIDPGVVEFCLNGIPDLRLSNLGANRNIHLLLAGNGASLGLDDDLEFRFAKAPCVNDGIKHMPDKLDCSFDPAEIQVYRDRESLVKSETWEDIDLLGRHQEWLGREVNLSDLDRLSDETTIDTARGIKGKILLSVNGMTGDCGWGSPSRYLFIDNRSFGRITISEHAYREAVTSREISRVVPSVHITERPGQLMTPVFAVDGRVLIPPFMPVGRGSDVIFGELLKIVQPNALFAHLPFAILHSPFPTRRFWPGEVTRSAATTDIKDIVCGLLALLNESGVSDDSSSGDIVDRLGKGLIEIAERSPADFHGLLKDCYSRSLQREVSMLEDRIGRSELPSVCLRDMEQYLHRLRSGQSEATAGIPAEVLYARRAEQALSVTQKLVYLYGKLLRSWSEMINVSLRRNWG